jgi:hypothetical protein
MSVSAKEYLKSFQELPFQEQLQLSNAINGYLNDYFRTLTLQLEQEDKINWQVFSRNKLAEAYSNDEPTYTLEDTL